MIFRVLQSLQYTCRNMNFTDYPKNLSEIEAGPYLAQSQINDIVIDTGIFSIKFTDIKIDDYVLPMCDTYFCDGKADFNIKDMSLMLKAQFKVMQNTYPYFQDSGIAKFRIIGIQLSSVGRIIFDDSCPLHYFINIVNPSLRIENLAIELDGNLVVLYNSILQVLTSMLQSQFGSLLGAPIVDAVMAVANNALGNNKNYVLNPIYTGLIGFDQQPISGSIDSNFLTINMVGQTLMHKQNPQDQENTPVYGYKNYTYSQHPKFATNHHIQYLLHYLTFQSSFDKMLKQRLINSSDNNSKIIQIITKGFANLGLYSTVHISHNHSVYLVDTIMEVEADPYFYAAPTVNHTLIYVKNIKQVQVSKNGKPINANQELNRTINTLLNIISNATQMYGMQISNSNGIDQCNTLVINNDWIHVGCVLY